MRSKSNISPVSFRASGLLSKPCLVLCCVLFPLYTPSQAQTVPLPGDHNLIQERQQKLLEDQQRRLEELKRLPSEPAARPPRLLPSLAAVSTSGASTSKAPSASPSPNSANSFPPSRDTA